MSVWPCGVVVYYDHDVRSFTFPTAAAAMDFADDMRLTRGVVAVTVLA